MTYTFHIVLRPEPEGGYTVLVPSLPGCISFGKTEEEAKTMATDAIRGYLEVLKEEGEEIRDDHDAIETSISLAA